MANNTLSAIQNVLMKKEEYIGEQIAKPAKQKILTIVRQIKKDRYSGQDLKKYVKIKIRPSGGWGLVTEGGDYPAAQAQNSIEGSLVPRLVTHTYGITLHSLAAYRNQKPRQVGETLGSDLDSFIDTAQFRKKMMFCGRGDLVLARANAGNTGTASVTFTSSTDVPVRAVVGDYVTAFKDGDTNDERALDTEDTGTSYLGTTHQLINDVDYDANTVTLATASKWTDDAVLVPDGVSSSNMTGPLGLESLVDTVNDTSFAWDSEDSAAYDHDDTVYTLARATYSQLNCQTSSSSGYLTLDKLQRGVAKCLAKGARAASLVFLSHPTQFENLTQTAFGQVGAWKTLTMAGQNEDVFCVTGLGSAQIPYIVDYGIKKGVVIVLDRSKLFGLELPGGWDKIGDGIFQQQNASSGQGHSSAKLAYWNMWLNYGLVFPNTSCVIYGLST